MTGLAARRRSPLAHALLLVVALVGVGAAYSAVAPSPAEATATAPSEEDVAAGRELFLANCATCHGLDAAGTQNGPSLIGVGAAAVDFQVGTGRMPLQASGPQAPQRPSGEYSEEEIALLAAYVASLAPGPAIPTDEQVDPELGDPSRGSAIFRTNCAMCHNAAGAGGALTRGKYAPQVTGTDPVYVYEAMLTGPQSMPVFGDGNIDPESKRDIIAYLSALEAAPEPGGNTLGSFGPVTEGLFAWIVGLGLLIGSAVWLGQKAA